MEAVRDTINSALEKLNITGGAPQGTPAKEPSEEELKELKSKYQKAGQEQVFVRPPCLAYLVGFMSTGWACKPRGRASIIAGASLFDQHV
jgi:hypothetical protein